MNLTIKTKIKNINKKIQDADFILVSIPPVNGEDIVLKILKK